MNKKFIIIIISIVLIVNCNIVSACTGFTASNENQVLVGNNEDLTMLAEPRLIIYPPSGNSYGRVVFYCKWPYPFDNAGYSAFGGMNDKGLFFDIFSTPYLELKNPLDKPTFNNDIFAYCIKTCATVDEVIEVFDRYYIPYMDDIQGFFVDKTGKSVIIEGDAVIYKTGNYQVVTNFLQTHPELGEYPCWRYETVTSILENLTDYSADNFRDICQIVQMERVNLQAFILDTIYSYICDLKQGIMYIYFFHDYHQVVEIHLPEIFEQGYQSIDLASLFVNNSNHSPNKPEIVTGTISGKINNEYAYTTIGTDDDVDLLFYFFDWGDGTNSGWIGYHDSGERFTASHTWLEEGNYEIKVKTKDIYGNESEWSDPFSITMPKYKSYINTLILNFLDNHPIFYKLIQRLSKL